MSFAKIWFGLLVGGMLAGCGDAHLGDLYGRRTRNAFDAQAQAAGKGGDAAGALDADDAKTALARHRGRAMPGTPGAALPQSGGGSYNFGGGGAAPIVGGGTTSVGISASSPQGPIRLDAVR